MAIPDGAQELLFTKTNKQQRFIEWQCPPQYVKDGLTIGIAWSIPATTNR